MSPLSRVGGITNPARLLMSPPDRGGAPDLAGPSGPFGRNKVIRGVGNGVFAIAYADVAKHMHSNSVEIIERKISDTEIATELLKLERISGRFAIMKSDDDVFALMVSQMIQETGQTVQRDKINSDSVFNTLASTFITEQEKQLEKVSAQIHDLRTQILNISNSLQHETDAAVREQKCHEMDALDDRIGGFRDHLNRQRAFISDFHSLAECIVFQLQRDHIEEEHKGELHVAHNLSWPEIQEYYKNGAKGFVLDSDRIGPVSHPFIFSHDEGIPMVTIDNPLDRIGSSCKVSIDSRTGEVIINPTSTTVHELERRAKGYVELEKMLKAHGDVNKTLDRHPLPALQANIKDRDDIAHLKGRDVGLFRTEGLHMKDYQSIQIVVRILKDLFRKVNEVDIRFFDKDFDKIPDFLKKQLEAEGSKKEEDCACESRRGIDFLLNTEIGRSIIIDQIKSVLIAYDRLLHVKKIDMSKKTIRLIIPRVTNPQEVRAVRDLIKKVEDDLMERKLIRESVRDRIKLE